MLPKSLRLHGGEGFDVVFRTRKVISGPEISLFFRPTASLGTRIGFAFKQKAFPRAVTRNFLKRKGSAIMKEITSLLPRDTDMVLLFHKPHPEPVEYAFLKGVLMGLVERLNQAKK